MEIIESVKIEKTFLDRLEKVAQQNDMFPVIFGKAKRSENYFLLSETEIFIPKQIIKATARGYSVTIKNKLEDYNTVICHSLLKNSLFRRYPEVKERISLLIMIEVDLWTKVVFPQALVKVETGFLRIEIDSYIEPIIKGMENAIIQQKYKRDECKDSFDKLFKRCPYSIIVKCNLAVSQAYNDIINLTLDPLILCKGRRKGKKVYLDSFYIPEQEIDSSGTITLKEDISKREENVVWFIERESVQWEYIQPNIDTILVDRKYIYMKLRTDDGEMFIKSSAEVMESEALYRPKTKGIAKIRRK